MTKPKPGRPPKFKLGTIAVDDDGQTWVLVERRLTGFKSQYRGIRTNGRRRRYGRAKWMLSNVLTDSGEKSTKGSLVTYRANEAMDRELGGRGCDCQCCVHTAIPRSAFSHHTGEWKEDEE